MAAKTYVRILAVVEVETDDAYPAMDALQRFDNFCEATAQERDNGVAVLKGISVARAELHDVAKTLTDTIAKAHYNHVLAPVLVRGG